MIQRELGSLISIRVKGKVRIKVNEGEVTHVLLHLSLLMA